MTAVAENVTTDTEDTETAHSSAEDDVSSNRPQVDMMDVRDLSSGCLKRSSRIKQLNAKKQKIDAGDSSSTAAAGSNQPMENNEPIVVSSSVTTNGSQSVESSPMENREDRCLLNTSTGSLCYQY